MKNFSYNLYEGSEIRLLFLIDRVVVIYYLLKWYGSLLSSSYSLSVLEVLMS